MKKLRQFINFDSERFFHGKTLMFIDFKMEDSDKFKGAKVNLIVSNDDTKYSDNETHINDLERFTLKIPNAEEQYLRTFKKKESVRIEIDSAVVWGDYQQNLTVTGKLKKANV